MKRMFLKTLGAAAVLALALPVAAQTKLKWAHVYEHRVVAGVLDTVTEAVREFSGRIVALFPGFTGEYVRAVRTPDLGDYLLT